MKVGKFMTIGKLIEVDIRELWAHEQYDFSNWLSKSENIGELNNIVGSTLTDIEKESYVGAYRCDLVAIDEPTDTKVIIDFKTLKTSYEIDPITYKVTPKKG